jgi:hypothetical protein
VEGEEEADEEMDGKEAADKEQVDEVRAHDAEGSLAGQNG